MQTRPFSVLRLVLAFLGLAASVLSLGAFVPGAGAAGSHPYALDAEALFSPDGTDLTLRVSGPVSPTVLEKVQVKAWPRGSDEAVTRNFFDLRSADGVVSLRLVGVISGDLLQVRVHVKDGPQHNLETTTTVFRRPDLTVRGIDVPADIVRTRPFDVTVEVAETGGDVGATARLALFDGATKVGETEISIPAGGRTSAAFRIALSRPGDHALLAVVSESAPREWDVDPNSRTRDLYVNHYGENGVVATDHALATQAGVDVLRSGGNAFDAAAAVQFALAVVQPHLNGIGGGSNAIVRDGLTGEVFAIDARETAPAATTPTTYVSLAGKVRPNGFAVGVPGTVRAVDYMLRRWGTKPLAELLAPAIKLADEGFPVARFLADQIQLQLAARFDGKPVFQPETTAIFAPVPPGGTQPTPLGLGATLSQPDLAKTLRLLERDGLGSFYDGEIAQAIVEAQRRAPLAGGEGKMTRDDLRDYAVDARRPLEVSYNGYDVNAPHPGGTSGGVSLLESLGLMREFLARHPNYLSREKTANSLHLFIEAMRLAFADRDFWMGDDRYTNVPTVGLLNRDYLLERSKLIKPDFAICGGAAPLPPGNPLPYAAATVEAEADVDEPPATPGPGHTTHFSIVDRWGNAVVMTSTIRSSFGTGITVPGYGFLLNDSLGLFNQIPRASAANPGANDAAGGKRPLGNMTPTLILKDDELFAGTGTLGSDFIPSVVLNVVLNLIEHGMPVQQAVAAPRIWIRVSTGAAQLNAGLDHLIAPVRAMGHLLPCSQNLNLRALAPYIPIGTPDSPGPTVGSTGSFAVDLETFTLAGGEDSARVFEAKTTVVPR